MKYTSLSINHKIESSGRQLTLLLVVCVMVAGLFSCEKDAELAPATEVEATFQVVPYEASFEGTDFVVADGRLKLNSEKEVRQLISKMSENPSAAYKVFTTLDGFKSSRALYLELMEDESLTQEDVAKYSHVLYLRQDDTDTYVDHTVDDQGVELLANARGLMQVGDFIYDYSVREKPVKVKVADYDFNNADFVAANHASAVVLDIHRTPVGAKINVVTCDNTWDRKNRSKVVGQLEDSHVFASGGILWNFNIRTRFYRKRFGIYWGKQADELRSNWDLWVDVERNGVDEGLQHFVGNHTAASGDRQNTRFMILERVDEDSEYVGGQPGLDRSTNIARYSGQSGSCNCNLN
ncbi:hypothetical protein FUA23_21625 [Neolewinella aurantiaca]|uniref:Uncharacterized protein n=1 Tax=Neolewinella aurantiaca TaxID=2602767 RepID=A0A5C7FE34_9BACT|nr:hypothetical protein [Neolewinella aurantiaca]TXF83352.1 hypothetical protein FUA23_21625 [Neolewinella aurantiaca]